MHSGLFYWQSVFISEADLLGWLVLPELCLVHINNKPVKTFYLKIEKLLNLKQERHATRHQTPDQRRTGQSGTRLLMNTRVA